MKFYQLLFALCVVKISFPSRGHDIRMEMKTNLTAIIAQSRENTKKFFQNIFNNSTSINNVPVEAQVF